jgi:hypothetical protein
MRFAAESHFGPIRLSVNDKCLSIEEPIMMRSVSLVLAVFLMSSAALAQSQYENSDEDRACRGDAHRFCKDDLPDQFKVGSCLQMHKDKLSRTCKEMLTSHGMM